MAPINVANNHNQRWSMGTGSTGLTMRNVAVVVSSGSSLLRNFTLLIASLPVSYTHLTLPTTPYV